MTHTVPIFHIDRFNVAKHTPVLLAALKASEIISIDLELSGLGKRPGISSKDLTKRYQGLFTRTWTLKIGLKTLFHWRKTNKYNPYKAMKEAADTYSIISIGICFMTKENHCSLFQLNVSKPDINLNRETAKFLLDHGFNFDQLYSRSTDYSQVGTAFMSQTFKLISSFRRRIILSIR